MDADCRPEIHVLDVGTLYRGRLLDNCLPFDPVDATVMRLIFGLPGGVVITKDATLEAEGSPPTDWFLTYQVQPNDGLGSPPGEFHESIGPLKIQAYLEWADGSKFHSNIRTTDSQGRELRIHKNLD